MQKVNASMRSWMPQWTCSTVIVHICMRIHITYINENVETGKNLIEIDGNVKNYS